MRAVRGGGVDVLHQLSTRVARAATPDPDPSDEPPSEPTPSEPIPSEPPRAGYGPIVEVDVDGLPTCERPVVSNAVSRLGAARTFEQTRFFGGGLVVDFVRSDTQRARREIDGGDLPSVQGEPERLGAMPTTGIERASGSEARELGDEPCVGGTPRDLVRVVAQHLFPKPFPEGLIVSGFDRVLGLVRHVVLVAPPDLARQGVVCGRIGGAFDRGSVKSTAPRFRAAR
jgi:hypothetical protein